jgi:type I restriction enzyme, S subunit
LTTEWIEVDFGQVATLQRGYDLPYRVRKRGEIPVVTSTGVTDTHSEAKEQAPGVVTGRYGTIGEVFFIEEDYWPHNTTLFVKDFHGNDPLFVSYILRTIDFQSHSGKSGVPGVNRNDLHALRVRIPPTEAEQRAIATALSDMDALLAGLDRLIAKKRDLKQATMQALLNGRVRLPGFNGRWEVKRLSELADVDPENLSSNTNPDYTFNYISLEQVDAGRLLGYSEERFGTAPSRARRLLRDGDVLMSTVRPNLMAHLLFRGQVANAVCSTGFAVIRSRRNLSDAGYLFLHLFGRAVNEQIEKTIAGSNYPAINSRDVKALEIPIPPTVEEQTAIAAVLADMDAEIAALEQRRRKTQDLKQAMMQDLLTGRIRLV